MGFSACCCASKRPPMVGGKAGKTKRTSQSIRRGCRNRVSIRFLFSNSSWPKWFNSMQQRGPGLRQRNQFALAKLIAGFTHGARDCRPILQVGGEEALHHAMRQLSRQTIQHHGGISLFISQPAPLKIVEVPAFG